jgi:hypothetical protein
MSGSTPARAILAAGGRQDDGRYSTTAEGGCATLYLDAKQALESEAEGNGEDEEGH